MGNQSDSDLAAIFGQASAQLRETDTTTLTWEQLRLAAAFVYSYQQATVEGVSRELRKKPN
jgi:hypothetical protein